MVVVGAVGFFQVDEILRCELVYDGGHIGPFQL